MFTKKNPLNWERKLPHLTEMVSSANEGECVHVFKQFLF